MMIEWSLVLYVVDTHDVAYTAGHTYPDESTCMEHGRAEAWEWNQHHLPADHIYPVCRPQEAV